MRRIVSKCVMTPKYTAMAVALWLLLPASGIAWLFSIVGPDPCLLYLAGVTLLPASMALLTPWLRAWLEVRKEESVRIAGLQKASPVPATVTICHPVIYDS